MVTLTEGMVFGSALSPLSVIAPVIVNFTLTGALTLTGATMVGHITCRYSLSLLEQTEHFETKIEQIRRHFRFCNKTASAKN